MNKKQGVIIVVLLALIVCFGILATKLNADLDYVAGNDMPNGKSAISINDSSKKNSSSNFFQEQQIIRDNKEAQALQTLKSLMDDEHTSKEDKAEISKKYSKLALAGPKQSQIETVLKGKDYEDALCYIQEKKVTIIVKSPKELTEEQKKQIQEVVMDVTQIRDVEIERKE
ncbi:SpoIIIAH-like family protein [Clostridium ganghwense]|uniref:SpoIIIAH-like family protein n=1 Tax=Clostridium ganghwense TaxID=312089 RepID=A0ABT4CMQ8_9CLOT|nr:SpoIIIAH-like family protein [Clostridium ganghwense]MCY6370317.1 SpoIIIAH-like family protein [Clostridium ganghwense]